MGTACKLEINNDEYYVPCDQLDNIVYENNYLYSVGSSITLYSGISDMGTNVYPRITIPVYSKATIQNSQSSQRQTLVVNSFNVVSSTFSTFNSVYILAAIFCVCVFNLFKRG